MYASSGEAIKLRLFIAALMVLLILAGWTAGQ